jgi:hypothetical protein
MQEIMNPLPVILWCVGVPRNVPLPIYKVTQFLQLRVLRYAGPGCAAATRRKITPIQR